MNVARRRFPHTTDPWFSPTISTFMAQRYRAWFILTKLLKMCHQNIINILMSVWWKLTTSYQQFCVARSSRRESKRYVTRFSDNACAMTIKSRSHILTNHNHTVLVSQLMRDQETTITHTHSRMCVCWKRLKGELSATISRVGYFKADHNYSRISKVYFRTQLRTAEELPDILSGTSKSCPIRSSPAVIYKVKFRR